MSYQSLTFLLFAAVTLLLYYIVGRKLQKWVLAAANLAFYAIAGVQYLPFLLATMLATFFAAKGVGRIYEKADQTLAAAASPAEKKEIRAAAKKRAKRYLLVALLVAVGLLAVCKYTGFVLTNLNGLLALCGVPQIGMFRMILPLGVSFYTFMALSYVLDVYWKRYKAESNFLLYAVYLSYFPHVVQGPIDRYNEFKPQLEQGVALSYKNLTYGAQLALWGFFKKLVIADRLGIFVDTILNKWEQQDGLFIMVAVTVYSIQIYADFSGCIDIVTGISEMFGIKMRKNFNHPYFSKTMGEFWRRWHISLQEWFKDYIYYPVSASELTKKIKKRLKGKGRAEELFSTCFPVLVVWLITGIWHGAAWKFVAWGLFHAALLIGSKVFEPLFGRINRLFRINTEHFGWRLWQMARTFFLCCVGRVFFRAGSLRVALSWFGKMLTDTSLSALSGTDLTAFGLTLPGYALAALSVLVLWAADMLQERKPLRDTLAKQNLLLRWVILFIGLFVVILCGIYGPDFNAASFIYEQF